MDIVVFNLGCKVNQYECDLIIEKLQNRGYNVTDKLQYADVYIINTCAVTSEAERKSRQAVARCLKFNDSAKIIVCGCASQHNPSSFSKSNVVFVTGVANKMAVIDEVESLNFKQNIEKLPLVYEDNTLTAPSRTRAYVKIQDGCNNFCSYCIIPYLRGRSRSRSLQEVRKEVDYLSDKTSELVLTGINFVQYGEDIGTDLTKLIESLSDIEGRIRLGSFYVEALNYDLLTALFNIKNFCPHFHLSLQSGDNNVLRAMNRKYTTQEYEEKIKLIRSFDSNASITTDIIVGYPTETEEEAENTYNFLRKIGFSDIHVFPFSSREGTVAGKLKQLDNGAVIKRRDRLLELKKELHSEFLDKNIGVVQNVLIEEKIGDYFVGYSERYIKIYCKNGQINNVVRITPTKKYKDGLI